MKAELLLLKIPVNDIERAVAFYRDALGWKLEFVEAEYGWAQFELGNLPFALYVPGMGGGTRTPGGSVDFHLALEDIESIQAKLESHSPDFEAGIFTNDDGSRTLEFQDPDGNEWKISELS